MIFSNNSKILILIAKYNLPPMIYKAISDQELQIGHIVEVSLKGRNYLGIVIATDIKTSLEESKIKSINSKANLPKITSSRINFIQKSAKYYLGSDSSFLKMTIPIKKVSNDISLNNQVNDFNLIKLNNEQEEVYKKLSQVISKKNYSTTLLDGVTGSGKTEIYFYLIRDIIYNNDSQVLILLPEIVLISQLIAKFKSRFNFEPFIWHSGITEAKKNKTWHEIINGSARVIIGTRSALYLPFKKLSLIIVEEEHDNSYKQEEGVMYHARDAAILNAFIEKIPVLLVSATPSLETYINVVNNKYQSIKLSSRFNNLSLPCVKICDLQSEELKKGEWIAESLKQAIIENTQNNNQVLLFLNRRGYAPLLLCKKCGYKFECKFCSSFMVEHKVKHRLECHQCGIQKAVPKNCPECKEVDSLISCGPGVERLTEEVQKFLPSAKILLMTKDTIKSTKDAQNAIERIINHEIDIIIGTQLIAKGHHFPDLALVGVIDADVGINGGDLRAPENTFQLLEQVGGRAGREKSQGTVIIQTYYPNNNIIKAIQNHDKDNFYKEQMLSRKSNNMPPYSKLCSIIISGTYEDKTKNIAQMIVKNAPNLKNIMILGPSNSIIFKVRKKYRFRILVKAPKFFDIAAYVDYWIGSLKIPSSIHVKIDIDPYNFL